MTTLWPLFVSSSKVALKRIYQGIVKQAMGSAHRMFAAAHESSLFSRMLRPVTEDARAAEARTERAK
jgi:hypothetical protein